MSDSLRPVDVFTPGSPVTSAHETNKTEGSDDIKSTDVAHKTNALVQPNGTKLSYIDPNADASLVSLEGRTFKVQSFVLKAHSTFFLQHLGEGTFKSDPFKIPASSRIIKAWLDLAHLHNRPPKMVWNMREPLLKLCDYLGSRGVSERALFLMHSCIENDPWELFCLASHKNNIGLAKSALRALAEIKDNGGNVPAVDGITPALASDVALPYLLGIYVAALKGKDRAASHNGSLHGHLGSTPGSPATSLTGSDFGDLKDENGWRIIAEKFVPIVG